ncbi:hypothetical protein LUZ60_000405 [Juncus effusus]|nr:hypothetical protein LUZ60_000405 [Juncus effusus]
MEPIQEIQSESQSQSQSSPNPNPKSVQIKSPEVEVRLYRSGKGPAQVFPSKLGGWEQNQLEVGDILDKFGLKSIHSFNPDEGKRGVAIRFNPKNGRSIMSYTDGSVVVLDGEPKDSMVMPVTKILLGIVICILLIVIFFKEMPKWLNTDSLSKLNFPPWILACMVIVFMRLRKRTKDLLKKFGW